MKIVFENREFLEKGASFITSSLEDGFFIEQTATGEVLIQPIKDRTMNTLICTGTVMCGIITLPQMGQLAQDIGSHPATCIVQKIEGEDRAYITYTLCRKQ